MMRVVIIYRLLMMIFDAFIYYSCQGGAYLAYLAYSRHDAKRCYD